MRRASLSAIAAPSRKLLRRRSQLLSVTPRAPYSIVGDALYVVHSQHDAMA